MNVYFSNLWNQLKASFWLLPAVMVLCTLGFTLFTLYLDRRFENELNAAYGIWQGDAEGARQLLAAIAGSMITMTGVVFSITIVSLSLASTQYGSRLLRSFMRDMGTQAVLGTFISTSIYALLILKIIRSDSYIFIPNISITISLILAILSLNLLIYFIHHLSVGVQSADVTARVAQDLMEMVQNLSPGQATSSYEGLKPNEHYRHALLAKQMGYVQAIDYQALSSLANNQNHTIEVYVRAGHFVRKGSILAKTDCKNLSSREQAAIVKSFIIGKERSPTQDLEYAIDQLVAIALRALGLNANDTFTVNACLDYLGAALCILCTKNLNPPFYNPHSSLKLVFKQTTFEGLVDASFNQIRQYGSLSPSVLIHLVETLSSILSCTKTENQRQTLIKHVRMIQYVEHKRLEETDKNDLQERIDAFYSQLQMLKGEEHVATNA